MIGSGRGGEGAEGRNRLGKTFQRERGQRLHGKPGGQFLVSSRVQHNFASCGAAAQAGGQIYLGTDHRVVGPVLGPDAAGYDRARGYADANVQRARVMSRAEAERRDGPNDRQAIFDYGTNRQTRETCNYLDQLN